MRLGICGPIDTGPLASYLETAAEIPPGLGGTPVVAVARAALTLGWNVTVFSLDPAVREEIIVNGPHGLKLCLGPYRERGRARDLFASERECLRRAIQRERPDVVHAHWTYEFALGALDSGVPTVVTAHDRPLRILRWDHSPYRIVRTLMAGMVARRAPGMTAVSSHVAGHFQRYFGRCEQPDVIPNAIEDRWFRERPPLRPEGPFTFASVLTGWGKLKNGAALLRAFGLARRELPDVRLLLFGCGHGPGEAAERWARERSLREGVSFLGQVEASALRRRLHTADALVHPSLEESFSMTVAEAMASSIPAIVARQGAASADASNALITDGDSPAAIAADMVSLARDPSLRADLAARAHACADKRYRASAVFAQYAGVYRRL
jgi:glycosyltransferase involved in cell wall biosynthesis